MLVDKHNELMSDLLFIVHHQEGQLLGVEQRTAGRDY